MKIGTDGCLLGAWANPNDVGKALDIGTGTGLIACMLAQRFPNLHLDAIELDSSAAAQAASNVQESPFNERISVFESNLLDWSAKGYDYIVCNPPFFSSSSSSATGASRIQARQETQLRISDLFTHAFELATDSGRLSIVWPSSREWEALQSAEASGWYLRRKCELFPTPNKASHRLLLEFSKEECDLEAEKLVIEELGRHQYSDAYKALLKEFYLKF